MGRIVVKSLAVKMTNPTPADSLVSKGRVDDSSKAELAHCSGSGNGPASDNTKRNILRLEVVNSPRPTHEPILFRRRGRHPG